jgi:RHS repeat-associated protein
LHLVNGWPFQLHPGWAYEWAGNGMLNKVITPNNTNVTFTYDPLGRRIAKVVKEKVCRYIWDGNVLLHEWKYDGDYPPAKIIDEEGIKDTKEPIENLVTWLYEEGSFIPCAKIEAENRYSIVADDLGTPTHAYNETGTLIWERELDCYGAVRKEKGGKGLIPQLYQGQYVDSETGLAYNRFRYYDVDSGGYISQDPITLNGGMNLYAYIKDSNCWTDPMGLMPWPNPVKSGHHLVYAGKANSIGLSHLGSYTETPTYFFNEPYTPGAHERIHAAQKPHVDPRQGAWAGTADELIEASKKGLVGLDDIKGDLRIPKTGDVLAHNVTPLEAFEKLEEWHKQKIGGNH